MLLSKGNDSDFQAAGLIAETSACIQGNCRRKEALSFAPPSHGERTAQSLHKACKDRL